MASGELIVKERHPATLYRILLALLFKSHLLQEQLPTTSWREEENPTGKSSFLDHHQPFTHLGKDWCQCLEDTAWAAQSCNGKPWQARVNSDTWSSHQRPALTDHNTPADKLQGINSESTRISVRQQLPVQGHLPLTATWQSSEEGY